MTENAIIECVPNFSEGRDMSIIRQITDATEGVEGVRLLHVDPGYDTNRTVVTFAGRPQAVVEAAFQGAKKAAEVIDMRRHRGTHPRQGATDVLPLVPISGITLEECALLGRQLAQRMAAEASIPCYAYEASALRPEHQNLADCRAGEYEALYDKLTRPELQPDFLPDKVFEDYFHENITTSILRSGISVVGARNILLAVNWNLNTASTIPAKAIAREVRAKGGSLPCTKAIGWFIEEYGIAQVSMNMTNLSVTPLHVAYEEVCRRAEEHGVRVTGTEIIGLVPRQALIDAGRHFLMKEQKSIDLPEAVVMKVAIKGLGLDDLRPFNAREKVIEYLLES